MQKTFFILIFSFLSQFIFSFVQNDETAPDFQLLDSNGDKIALSYFRGKKVVLEWTNHGCPFVAKHYESGNMQSTQDFVKDKNTVWLSIISSAPGTQGYISPEKANELTVSRNAFPSHVLFDPSGVVGRKYSAKTTPHMYIIDEQGLLKYQGAIDDAGGRGFMSKDLLKANNYVKKGLKELASGEEVSSPVTKPYGCSVKYSS